MRSINYQCINGEHSVFKSSTSHQAAIFRLTPYSFPVWRPAGMTSTITTGLRTFHHRREAGAAAGAAATPTPPTITATKTITTITDMTTTTTGAATTTRTTAMTTTRAPAGGGGAGCAAAPVRPGAAARSRQGADWPSPRGEALEQAAEVNGGQTVLPSGCSETLSFFSFFFSFFLFFGRAFACIAYSCRVNNKKKKKSTCLLPSRPTLLTGVVFQSAEGRSQYPGLLRRVAEFIVATI